MKEMRGSVLNPSAGEAARSQRMQMRPVMKSFFLIIISSVLFFGCSGKGLSGGLGSGSGSGGGSGSFNIGGTVVGLAGTGMVLEDNGGDDLPITANGTFTF